MADIVHKKWLPLYFDYCSSVRGEVFPLPWIVSFSTNALVKIVSSDEYFYCYYRERERNSYNIDDKNILLLDLDVMNNCITYTLCNMPFILVQLILTARP